MLTTRVDSVLFVTVLSVIIALSSSQNAPPAASPFNKLADHFFYKCSNITKSNAAFDKLYKDSVDLNQDLQYAFTFIPKATNTFCDSQRRHLDNKMAEVSDDLKACLTPQEKYLSDFVKESFKEFLHFLCHRNGENIAKFFSARAESCRTALESSGSNGIGECFSRIFKPASGTPSKKELCEDLTVARRCLAGILNQQCPNFTPYKTLNEDFFNYVSQPCSGCTFFSNIFMLFTSLTVSYFAKRIL